MVYEIFTYGGGDYIIEALNAIVRVMNGNTFLTAMKISLLFGLFTMMFDIALNGNFTKGVKYYLLFLLAYNGLVVPRVDVLITDPIAIIRADRKIDNVPFGLAFMGHTISSLGSWMTEAFGINFTLPNDLQYNKNGLLFGSTLIKQTFSSRMSDQRINGNFNNYVRQCIIPSIQLKRANLNDVIKSPDLDTFLNYGKNGVLAYEYNASNNEMQNKLCNNVNDLKSDINMEVKKLLTKQQNTSGGSAGTVLDYILGIQQSTTKTFEQALIMNAIGDTTQEYLAMAGADAGATNYAITKDDLQKKLSGIIQWIQADKYLPLLKITIETMFYALFPIAILMTMLPNGFKYFKAYLMILLALQM